jgi:hypothetical protein
MTLEAVQDAVFDQLAGDATLVAMLASGAPHVPIYQDPPETATGEDDTAFPYISFGQDVLTPFNTATEIGGNIVIQLDVWTRERRYRQCKRIADRVRAVLERAAIDVVGLVTVELESASFSADPDGKTKHGVMLFRVVYMPDAD